MRVEVQRGDEATMKDRVIRMANERGDFVRMEDGYTCYWPTNEASRGALPSWALRVLADEMDKRDATWHAIICGDHRIGPPCVQVWKWADAPGEWKKLSTHGGDEDWLALIPVVMLGVLNEEPDLWWMRWYPTLNEGNDVKRYKEGVPEGFEIWIGAHGVRGMALCTYCHGNDRDRPCAYPSEGKPGCLREARLSARSELPSIDARIRIALAHMKAGNHSLATVVLESILVGV